MFCLESALWVPLHCQVWDGNSPQSLTRVYAPPQLLTCCCQSRVMWNWRTLVWQASLQTLRSRGTRSWVLRSGWHLRSLNNQPTIRRSESITYSAIHWCRDVNAIRSLFQTAWWSHTLFLISSEMHYNFLVCVCDQDRVTLIQIQTCITVMTLTKFPYCSGQSMNHSSCSVA